ncbi:MAG: PQQ-binding-like beta-propeller repeat protein [Bythopirellula sp.]
MLRITAASAFVLNSFFAITAADANDWLRFRGPNGSGISAESEATPVDWSPTENLKWKLALPGPGSSCPIVVGQRVFVTSWSGYGTDRDEPGDQAALRRHLTCVDRATGDEMWTKTIQPYLPEDVYRGMFAEHGYASHTPVSDGEQVYVFFGKTGALAFDLEGKQLWHTSVGTESGAKNWGTSSSPILYKNLLIVTASAESEALVALDKHSGNEVWRQEAAGFNSTWGTPVLVEVDDSRTDLVIAVPGEIWGFNPETGKLRWYCEAIGSTSFCSSAVARDGMVYAMDTGPGGGGGAAVRAGGNGDVSETHIVWEGRQSGRICTPLLHEGRLYGVSRGVFNCFDATTGDELFKERLTPSAASATAAPAAAAGAGQGQPDRGSRRRGRRGGRGQDYSSPVLADGKIYFASRGGDIYVLEAGQEFRQLAVNRVTSEKEDFSATPAISRGEIFIRSDKNLYCVAKSE